MSDGGEAMSDYGHDEAMRDTFCIDADTCKGCSGWSDRYDSPKDCPYLHKQGHRLAAYIAALEAEQRIRLGYEEAIDYLRSHLALAERHTLASGQCGLHNTCADCEWENGPEDKTCVQNIAARLALAEAVCEALSDWNNWTELNAALDRWQEARP